MIEFKTAEEFKSGKPGIYLDVPEADYFAFPAASNSTLCLYEQNPGNVPWSKRAPIIEGDDATDLGSLVHCKALTPHLFNQQYIVQPLINKQSKKGKAEAEAFEWQAEQSGLKVITEALNTKADNMVASMMAHPEFERVLTAQNLNTEVTLLWVDEQTGVLCKCRCDTLIDLDGHAAVVMDLKTIAALDKIKWAIRDHGYDRQQVHYTEGLLANGFTEVHWRFGFVSSSLALKRYPVDFVRLRGELIEDAQFCQRKRLAGYSYSLKTNDWFGDTEI